MSITLDNVSVAATNINVTLKAPSNNSVFSRSDVNFTADYNISTTNFNWTNATYNLWFENSSLVNSSFHNITGQDNQTTKLFQSLDIGDYVWNVYACYQNSTFDNCTWASANYSFSVGASVVVNSFLNNTYETFNETFTITINLLEGAEISLAQLVYNGTNYTITDINSTGNQYTLSRVIDIPLNNNPLANETKSFFWRFTYEGNSIQELGTYNQNVTFINFQLCNPTFTSQALNFTLLDETYQTKIDASAHTVSYQNYYTYWLGSGDKTKNYSFSETANITDSDFQFCLYPVNLTMKTNLISLYSAADYAEREYFLNNASITNTTSHIHLYILNDSAAVKFTNTVKESTTLLQDTYVTISKFFIGDGVYKTVSIRKTDDSGQFIEYLELDRDYRYSFVKDGSLVGVIDRRSSCATAPCEETFQITGDQDTIWSSYYDVYATNIISNITYNASSKIVTYSFIDTTGLAQYFRLEVLRGYNNQSGESLCNEISYSSSGTLTCNLTGYYGDFIANTYISRSPEKVDQVLSFMIGELKESLGTMTLFLCFAIIVTLVFAGAAISGGNPSVILFMFGFSILITKLMTLFPYSWGIVAVLELLIVFLMSKVRS